VGTFELAAVTIAASVGIAREPALAFAILVHVTTLLLTSLGGAVALILGGRRRGATRREAVRPEASPPGGPEVVPPGAAE